MSANKRIVAIILILCTYGSYIGYNSFIDFVHNKNIERCVDSTKENNSFITSDYESFCTCQMEIVKGKISIDKESPEFIESFANKLGECVSEHFKKNDVKSCRGVLGKSDDSSIVDAIWDMTDCSCFIDGILPYIISSFTSGTKIAPSTIAGLDILERCRRKDG